MCFSLLAFPTVLFLKIFEEYNGSVVSQLKRNGAAFDYRAQMCSPSQLD